MIRNYPPLGKLDDAFMRESENSGHPYIWVHPTVEQLLKEQRRTNALLALQAKLLIRLVVTESDGWCDISAESRRLEEIMGEQ